MSITQTQADPTPRVMDDYEWTEIDFTALVTEQSETQVRAVSFIAKEG